MSLSNLISNSVGMADWLFVEPPVLTALPLVMGFTHGVEQLYTAISWEAVYLAATAIIGLMILYVARLLKKHQGQLPSSLLFSIASIAETAWFVVSGCILYFANFTTLPNVIASAYVIYSVFGWGYGLYLLKHQDIAITDKSMDNIPMPSKYMDYSLAFAFVITLFSLGFLGYMFEQGVFSLGV